MKLPHLALTVIERLEEVGRYHWVLLRAIGDADRVEEHSASDESFPTAYEAFQAGASCWQVATNCEGEDADPVGRVE